MTEPRSFTDSCAPCGGTGERIRINGSWLQHRRKGASITLEVLAGTLGLSKSYLSAIERGRRPCPANVAAAYDALITP